MNYLAHLVLSPANDNMLFGNYIADSIRPKQQIDWNDDMRYGYALHIDIDQFTDRNAGFKKAKELLMPSHKKYAPVVLDILNDHLLAANWSKFFAEDFTTWQNSIYKRLAPFQQLELPLKARRLIDGLMKHKYLHVYASQEGTLNVLTRMDQRTSFDSNFYSGVEDLNLNYQEYEQRFFELMYDLMEEFPPAIASI